jgi:hypothetical protein
MTIFGSFFDECVVKASNGDQSNTSSSGKSKKRQKKNNFSDDDECGGMNADGDDDYPDDVHGTSTSRPLKKKKSSAKKASSSSSLSGVVSTETGKKPKTNTKVAKSGAKASEPKTNNGKKSKHSSSEISNVADEVSSDEELARKKSKKGALVAVAGSITQKHSKKAAKGDAQSSKNGKRTKAVHKKKVDKHNLKLMKMDVEVLRDKAKCAAKRVYESGKISAKNLTVLENLNRELIRRDLETILPGDWCENDKKQNMKSKKASDVTLTVGATCSKVDDQDMSNIIGHDSADSSCEGSDDEQENAACSEGKKIKRNQDADNDAASSDSSETDDENTSNVALGRQSTVNGHADGAQHHSSQEEESESSSDSGDDENAVVPSQQKMSQATRVPNEKLSVPKTLKKGSSNKKESLQKKKKKEEEVKISEEEEEDDSGEEE